MPVPDDVISFAQLTGASATDAFAATARIELKPRAMRNVGQVQAVAVRDLEFAGVGFEVDGHGLGALASLGRCAAVIGHPHVAANDQQPMTND